MDITKLLTKHNFQNSNRSKNNIKYIVVHYIGGISSAKNNAEYWSSRYTGNSAHYIVGHEGEVYQVVEDKNIAWHCGAKSYQHPLCRNSNSIGIEMCVRKKDKTHLYASDKDWYFEDVTVKTTIELIKKLMDKYDIPSENVIRHYDVTGKICPAPYVHFPEQWKAFQSQLGVTKPVANENKNSNDKTKELIKSLQQALNKDGFTDLNNKKLTLDGLYGQNTEYAIAKVILKVTKDTSDKIIYIQPKSKGELVKFVQSIVGAKSDGYYGQSTKNAVQNFQKEHKLSQDGIVGKNTLLKMIGR